MRNFKNFKQYNNFIPYKKQLEDERWINKSNEIKKRDFYECNNCGNKNNLEVHHTLYDKNCLAWEYSNCFLITLCRECHEIEHKFYFGKSGRVEKFLIDIRKKLL